MRDELTCRQVRKRLPAYYQTEGAPTPAHSDEGRQIRRHLQRCAACDREFRIFALTRTTLEAASAAELPTADDDFFRSLRARIARGAERPVFAQPVEPWAAALLTTARQMIPLMAMLLLAIIGATFVWSAGSPGNQQVALRPRERVMFSDMYDIPAPTSDDVLETLVAAEEKEDGK